MGWLALQITGSAWQVALLGSIRMVPTFVLSLYAGAVGDRMDRRRIMLVTNSLNLLTTVAILLTLATSSTHLWHLLLASSVKGATRAFDQTSRRALMFEIVGPGNLVPALSLENIGFSFGTILGPLVTGALLEVNDTAVGAFAFLTALTILALACVVFLRAPSTLPKLASRPMIGSIFEGLRYAYTTPAIAAVLTASVVMNLLFRYQLLIPVVAVEHLHVGPASMGLLAAASGIGVVMGSLAISSRRSIEHHGPVFLVGSIGVALFLLGFALSPWYSLSILLLIFLGISQVAFSIMQSGILLLASPPSLHSRVFGAQSLAVGTGSLVGFEMGAMASAIGVSLALVYNAAGGIVLLLLIAALMPALRRPIQKVVAQSEAEPEAVAQKSPKN